MSKKFQMIYSGLFLLAASFTYADDGGEARVYRNVDMQEEWCSHLKDTSIKGYIGVVGGVDPLSGTYKVAETSSVGLSYSSTMGGINGLVGGVLGFQASFYEYGFFALQGNGLYNTTNRTVQTIADTFGHESLIAAVKNNFQWGIDARFGGRARTANLYVLGGFESGSWKLRLGNASTASVLGVPVGGAHKRKTLWGGKVGAGVTFPIVDCVWMNMEYSYTWFGHMRKTLVDSITGVSWTHRASIQQNSVLWGLNFMF